MRLIKVAILSIALFAVKNISASELNNAIEMQRSTHLDAKKSQQRINSSASETEELRKKNQQISREIENLKLYQGHLNSLVESQKAELSSLKLQISDIDVTQQGVIPLMYRMIEALKVDIDKGIPLKGDTRHQRVIELEKMMARFDISKADKFRRILEAYEIELGYGSSLGLYKGKISLSGEPRKVEILHMGRISLLARSSDNNEFWLWEQTNRRWLALDPSFKHQVEKAFDIGSKRIAPGIISLPLSVTLSGAK